MIYIELFKTESRPVDLENYLFIDLIDSTKFINQKGRNQLVDLMTAIKNFIETGCDSELEGYRNAEMILLQDFPEEPGKKEVIPNLEKIILLIFFDILDHNIILPSLF